MGNSLESSISNSLYDITLSYADCADCKYHKYDSEEDKTYCLRPTKWSGFQPRENGE